MLLHQQRLAQRDSMLKLLQPIRVLLVHLIQPRLVLQVVEILLLLKHLCLDIVELFHLFKLLQLRLLFHLFPVVCVLVVADQFLLDGLLEVLSLLFDLVTVGEGEVGEAFILP